MKNSSIEWTTNTFNPWYGCSKVSPGCTNCYAEARDLRFAGGAHWGAGSPRQRTADANWRQPQSWNRAQARLESLADNPNRGDRPRIFCASLSDWLDEEVDAQWLADLLALIAECPRLTWQLLSKRPQNFRPRLTAALELLPANSHAREMADAWLSGYPPEHVWVGTTVEDQVRAQQRIPILTALPARVRFLSIEPLLGPIDLSATAGGRRPDLHWIIVGGESGHRARPMRREWAQAIRDQCMTLAYPLHFKQWGSHDEHGVRCSKHVGGRLLDGRTWDQFPVGFEPTL